MQWVLVVVVLLGGTEKRMGRFDASSLVECEAVGEKVINKMLLMDLDGSVNCELEQKI